MWQLKGQANKKLATNKLHCSISLYQMQTSDQDLNAFEIIKY